MRYINHWPDIIELGLPETVAQELQHRLLEPFADETSAKEFWNETSSTIIILEPTDSITDLQGDDTKNSGSQRVTTPYCVRDFHSQSSASFAWRTGCQ